MASEFKAEIIHGQGLPSTKVLDALHRLHAVRDAPQFPEIMMAAVQELIPCVNASFDSINLRTGEAANFFNGPILISHEEFMVRWNALCHQHPGIKFLASGGEANVFTVNDFLSQREFKKTAVYHEIFRACGGGYQIGVILPVPGFVVGVAINRDRNFTEKERTLIELLHPHIVQAFQNAQLFTSLRGVAEVDFRIWRNRGFTHRECGVLRWLIEGKGASEIAIILGAQPRTVGKHLENIYLKLNVESRLAAAAEARHLLGEAAIPLFPPRGK